MIELLVGFVLGAAAVLSGVIVGIRIGVRTPAEPSAPAPAAETEDTKEEQRRSREIDEGIHNLMTFSVNGKDGFDVGGL